MSKNEIAAQEEKTGKSIKTASQEEIAKSVAQMFDDMLQGKPVTERSGKAVEMPYNSEKESADDVRYRMSEDKTLMGAHNISAENLRNIIKMGGLANPSLAVIDTKNGSDNKRVSESATEKDKKIGLQREVGRNRRQQLHLKT